MPLAQGQILQNRYRIVKELGRGGFGRVYLAQDMQQGSRWVAIKEMIPDPNAGAQALAQARTQFRREAQLLMSSRYHNLPQVYEDFAEGGNEYLVMQYIEGRNLLDIADADWQQGRTLSESRVLGWAMQIMDALEYLHGQRPYPVLHRDVKPQNIILTPGGELYLVDFGLVKLLDPNNPQTMTALRGLGTPEYAPPEQYATGGMHTGPHSDVFALGATLYHLLTGQPPSTAADRLLPAPMTKPLVPPRQLNPAISLPVEQALVKALELAPADRFASVVEMRWALLGQGIVGPMTPLPGRRMVPVRWAIGAGAIAFLVTAVLTLVAVLGGGGGVATVTPTHTVIARVTPTPMSSTAIPVPPTDTPTSPPPTATPTPVPPTAMPVLSTDTPTSPPPTATPVPPTDIPTIPPPTAILTPVPTTKLTAEGYMIHIVQIGENIFRIALKYGTTVEAIAQVNGLPNNHLLYVGQRLVIPTSDDPRLTPEATTPVAGETRVREKDGAVMVYVPDGEFTMGIPKGEGDGDEHPQHTVYLDAFYIDRTEVTNAQYRKCVEAGICRAPTSCGWGEPTYEDASKADHPVVCVSWDNARVYCEWAGKRLPTEAEWEKAARGTDGRVYPWGNDFDCHKGNFDDEREVDKYVVRSDCDGYLQTAPVGSFPAGASPYGALDMAGNVCEWTSDWYDAGYYSRSPTHNPQGPDSGGYKVLRGGSLYLDGDMWGVRTVGRNGLHPVGSNYFTGFRCAQQ